MLKCDVREATHVELRNGVIERIVEVWGIGPHGSLAPPSRGGFGVVTASGLEVCMWEAWAYYRDRRMPLPRRLPPEPGLLRLPVPDRVEGRDVSALAANGGLSGNAEAAQAARVAGAAEIAPGPRQALEKMPRG